MYNIRFVKKKKKGAIMWYLFSLRSSSTVIIGQIFNALYFISTYRGFSVTALRVKCVHRWALKYPCMPEVVTTGCWLSTSNSIMQYVS